MCRLISSLFVLTLRYLFICWHLYLDWWMDYLQFYILFNSISVILGLWKGHSSLSTRDENSRICKQHRSLWGGSKWATSSRSTLFALLSLISQYVIAWTNQFLKICGRKFCHLLFGGYRDSERLCAMEPCFIVEKFPSPAGLEPWIPRSAGQCLTLRAQLFKASLA